MPNKIGQNEVTPENLYWNRRNFIRVGVTAGTAAAAVMLYRAFNPLHAPESLVNLPTLEGVPSINAGEAPNTFAEITNYNNFYEFSTSKTGVARLAQRLATRPWSVEIGGLAAKPGIFDIEELLRFPREERVYRFRCVEGWSMVIPWVGFPLKLLLDRVQPLGKARYVAFQSHYDPEVMQSSFAAGIDFPYVEGLRLDEALHPLTILAVGLYGKILPNQNGAPLRLVVPWKYGFKSIKSVARITLTEDEPPTTWNLATPTEYGFYSNVNPEVPHRRWSQARERRIGEAGTRETLLFNGYADEVADLYKGMDLRVFF